MKIAITGGIASGKSTICRYLEEKGYPVLYADKIAADLMGKGMANYEGIVRHFGKEILKKNGEIDRTRLRDIIFQDEEERKWLNRLTHPNILKEIFSMVDDYLVNFIEVPLVFEEGLEPYFDEVWLVDCGVGEQKRRLLAKGELKLEEIERIIASQLPREEKICRADVVLDSESPDLKERIDSLLAGLEERIRNG